MTSYAVSRGHSAPPVGKRFLPGRLRVYFCLDSCLVYIHFAHTQDHDYVLCLCGGTSGIVWTARFSLLSQKMENEENWLNAFSCKQWGGRSFNNNIYYQPSFASGVRVKFDAAA